MSIPVYVALIVALLLYFLDAVRNPKRIERLLDQLRANVLAQQGGYEEAEATPEHEAVLAEVQGDFERSGYSVLTDLTVHGLLLRVVSDPEGEHCIALFSALSPSHAAVVVVEMESELSDGRFVSTHVSPMPQTGRVEYPTVLMERQTAPWAAADLIEHHCRRVEAVLTSSPGTSVLRRRAVQELLDSLHRQAIQKANHRLSLGFSDEELRSFGVVAEDCEKVRAAIAEPPKDPSVF